MVRKALKIILILFLLWICVSFVYFDCKRMIPYLYDLYDGRYDMFHNFKFIFSIINLLWFLYVGIYLLRMLFRFYYPANIE